MEHTKIKNVTIHKTLGWAPLAMNISISLRELSTENYPLKFYSKLKWDVFYYSQLCLLKYLKIGLTSGLIFK